MSRTARKLKREVLNWARQKNLSGWRTVFRRILSNGVSSEKRLELLSDEVAHFPLADRSKRAVCQAIQLSSSLDSGRGKEIEQVLNYCLIIKPYISELEKGFIVVSFENQLEKILNCNGFESIRSRFNIIFIPSWSGLYSPSLFKLVGSDKDSPVFIMPVHEHERILVKDLGENCFPLPFNAASWVNHKFFQDDVERDIDCLIVANFASFKRHWLLFKALKGLPKTVTAVCVGVPLGQRSAESLRNEARDYGVSDRVKIVENPSQEDLRLYFQRSKVFCAMSHREGSFIAVAEALMSGTPVVMFENAHVGTKNLITPQVGALVSSIAEMRERILEFLAFTEHDRIRQIARESMSSQSNCFALNEMLSDWSLDRGQEWTRDIEEFYSMRLSFYYVDENAKEKLKADYDYFKEQGIILSTP